MSTPSVSAALRLSQGGTDPYDIETAFRDIDCARAVALSRNADTMVRVVAALAGGLPALIGPDKLYDPHLERVVHPLIGTAAGSLLLESLAQIAPVMWGADMARDLRNAVQSGTCSPMAAASLIGPSDEAAQLLESPHDIAQVIKRWGHMRYDDPGAWTPYLPNRTIERLLNGCIQGLRTVRDSGWNDKEPIDLDKLSVLLALIPPTQLKRSFTWIDANASAPYAACLPWLPKTFTLGYSREGHIGVPLQIVSVLTRFLPEDRMPVAIDAYAEASSEARFRHFDELRFIIQSMGESALSGGALPAHGLAALTRLASRSAYDASRLSSREDSIVCHEASDVICRLVASNPRLAVDVVTAVPWNDLPKQVQQVIISPDRNNLYCDAIAFARGMSHPKPPIFPEFAPAFFAAVDPKVWSSLPSSERQAWISVLDERSAVLAVSSLGADPAFVERAPLNNELVIAARRHEADFDALCEALIPAFKRTNRQGGQQTSYGGRRGR